MAGGCDEGGAGEWDSVAVVKGGGLRTRKMEVREKGYRLKARFRSAKNAAVLRILQKQAATNKFVLPVFTKSKCRRF